MTGQCISTYTKKIWSMPNHMVADLTFKIISQSMKGTSCNRNDFLSKMPVIYFVKDDRFSTGNWLNLRNLEEPSCAESFVNTSISKLLNSPSQFPFQTLFATLRKQQYLHRTTDLPWCRGLWCCWSTNHKSYCGGMWTWRTPQQCWLGGRQVHRGDGRSVLASFRVNIAA